MTLVAWTFLPGLIAIVVLSIWLRLKVAMPMDVANHRSLHAGEVPRIGGIAMMAACGLVLALRPATDLPGAIPLAALGLFVLSLLDDWYSLSVAPRLLGHLAAAILVVLSLPVPPVMAGPAIVALVWMANAYNFMDGADGLAGGMAVIGFGACALAALPLAPGMAWLCLVVAGAAAGFLVFNFPPARVFMGDSGSIPLGFLSGAIGLAGWRSELWPVWFPLLVFSPFLVDASVTLWRRLRQGERVWQAHRDHAYQRLILAGWSRRRLVLAAWLLMFAAAGSAHWLKCSPSEVQVLGLLAWGLFYGGLLWAIERRWRKATEPAQLLAKTLNSRQ